MNSKRIGKWVIVLFLLAALPGLTAVMAQEEQPAIETEGPMAAIPWSNTETEPNDSMASANGLSAVYGGIINRDGDVDYYKIRAMNRMGDIFDSNTPILIDIEAQSIGSPLKAKISLYAADGTFVDSADYNSATDPLLYYNLESGIYSPPIYYLAVENKTTGSGASYKYQVLVSNPLLISAHAANLGTGTVAGISFQAADVLAWSKFNVGNTTYEKWNMLLDLSDLGVKINLTNLAGAWRNSDFLLVGFAANVRLPGISQVVTPWDVVLLDPSRVGPNTAGTFQSWWAGRDHWLTTSAEKLDAIDWPNWAGAARLYASTAGTATLTNVAGGSFRLPDESLGLWGTANAWSYFFEGASVAGMGGTEDVIALTVNEVVDYGYEDCFDAVIYNMVILGTAQCGPSPQVPLTQKDIFRHEVGWCTDWEEYENYKYVDACEIAWHGPDHGWNYNIDAIEFWRK